MIISRLPSGGGNTKIIARAIGSPAAERDKPEALAGIIDAAQADIAALCNERGCNIPADPTFPDIIDGISGITHFTRPAQISGLAAAGAHDTAGLMDVSWTNPSGDSNFRGVRVIYKAGGYPSSATDGTVGYDGTGTSIRLSGLIDGTLYHIRAFSYGLVDGAYIYNTQTTGAQCTCTPTLNVPPQVSGLAVTVGSTVSGYMRVAWTNPTAATFAGVRIMYKAGSYPTSPTDGTLLYAGTGTAAEKTGLIDGTLYYIRAFSYNLSNSVYSYNNQTSGAQATGTPYINKGRVVFTESTTWTVPVGVTSVDVFLVGGGGSGGTSDGKELFPNENRACYSGGAGGYTKTVKKLSVTPGQKIAVVVGAGGKLPTSTQSIYGYGLDGGVSTFGSYSVSGGGGTRDKVSKVINKENNANEYTWQMGKSGGSGSGCGGFSQFISAVSGGDYTKESSGGSDGANGYVAYGSNDYNTVPAGVSIAFVHGAGLGQGSTTREFGVSGATLYAGGGAGCTLGWVKEYDNTRRAALGGDGGGGTGGVARSMGTIRYASAGTPNTGGGGGGGNGRFTVGPGIEQISKPGGEGGSGLCIVRWGY